MLFLFLVQRAAKSVGEPDEIDWEHYATQLPNVDVYRLRDDFEKFLNSIPDVPYDAEAETNKYNEKVGHQRLCHHLAVAPNSFCALQEAEIKKVREFAQARVEELEAVKSDMDDHKLDDQTTADEIYLRFPHWYEQEVAQALRMQVYRTEEEPDAREHATDDEKVDIIVSMARKSGLPAEDFLFEDESHLKERIREAEAEARAATVTESHQKEDAWFDQLYNVPVPTFFTQEVGGDAMTRRFENYVKRKDQEWKDSFKH